MKRIFEKTFALALLLMLLSPVLVLAQGGGGAGGGTGGGGAGGGTGGGGAGGGSGGEIGVNVTLDNPFKVEGDLFKLAEFVVNQVILPIGVSICVLAFIYSGFKYVMARGNEAEIKVANRALGYSVVGTAVLLGAWVLANAISYTMKQILG